MIKNNFWESLVWIIIWVAILIFIISWITNLLISSKETINIYNQKNIITNLKNSTENIIKTIDTSAINETEVFYLNKNTDLKEFEIFTWSINSDYKYIDKYWNSITDITLFQWDIYARILWVERDDNTTWENHQVIKASIKKLIKK